jgi:diguanylate cyclase (GGDEF)-like protein
MKLSKIFRFSTFGTLFVTLAVFFIYNLIDYYDEYKEEINKEVNKYILIEKEKLKEKVDLFTGQFEYIYNNINTPKEHKIHTFIEVIKNYNKTHKDKYIFIDSERGGILVHPNKEFIGIDFLKSNNEKLKKLKQMLIKISNSKNHFVKYKWINPKTNKEELKITYIRHIKNTPYFIGSGIYLDKIKHIQQEIKKRFLNEFIDSIFWFLALIVFLIIIFYLLLKNIIDKLENDLKTFDIFIKEEKIEKDKFYFDEFKELASKIEEILNKKNELLKDLEHQTYYDSLTNLPNKFKLEKDIQELNPKGAILVDIKNFSLINEYYSFEIGDIVLKEFANHLNKIKYDTCKLYRYSADEFVILNFGKKSCKKIIENINNYFKHNILIIKYQNEEIPINIETVIAFVKDNKKDLIKKLQLALLYAKKNDLKYAEYNEKINIEKEINKKFEAIEMVKKAINEDRVIPVFQKILKPDGASYECLVRIKEKDRLISPFFFLDAIKNTALYYEITKIMIKKSCEVFKNRNENFSINFSYRDLKNKEINNYLIEYIQKYNLQNRLIIELLETDAMEDFKDVIKFIKEIKPYGIKIAIDDFGTGYSNFSYLAEIRPDYLKIDGSLIKTIDKNKRYYTIVKHVNAFAHDLGVQTIAEFVHNEEVYKTVKELGIDCFQGYYIDEPKEKI